jgi:hypothetical protein
LPTTGIGGFCARSAIGHMDEPPSSDANSPGETQTDIALSYNGWWAVSLGERAHSGDCDQPFRMIATTCSE